MGKRKPSKASRKNDAARQLKRRQKKNYFLMQIKKKEVEIGDLQIEVQRLNKFINNAGEKVINKFNKLHNEQSNLLKHMRGS